MNIPISKWTVGPDRIIRSGGTKPVPSWYKMGLLNALIHFKPKVCLEIGTNTGGTVKVFERYFADYCPDGRLVTCDIIKHGYFDSRWTKQILVYPYSADEVKISSNEARKPALKDWPGHVKTAYDENLAAIKASGYGPFDFVFIDGDHSLLGISNDWRMAKELNIPVVAIDDVWCVSTAVPDFCFDVVRKEAKDGYCFEDWPVKVGMGVYTL